jgi:hypothetical protein
LSVVFGQSAKICWLNVIGHLYTSGLAMLSEILTEWVDSEAESGGRVSIDSMNNVVQSRKAGRVSTDEPDFMVVKAGFDYWGDLALAVVEVKENREGLMVLDWDQAL